MGEGIIEYPATLSIDYPDRQLNRLTTFFRIFAAIPILIIISLLSGASPGWEEDPWKYQAGGTMFVFLPTVLMILFQQKYPRWWFDWNLALVRFSTRITAYLALMTDMYPSTDDEQSVHLDIPYPNVKRGT